MTFKHKIIFLYKKSDIIDDLLATYGREVKDPSNGKIYRIVCDDSDDVTSAVLARLWTRDSHNTSKYL